MYKNNLQLVGKGGDLSFLAEVGIRQGCPLSPLVFAVVADVLLRTITNRLVGGVVILRAFADDTAIIVKAISSLEATFQIFTEYAKSSNLQLNFKKTYIGHKRPRAIVQ